MGGVRNDPFPRVQSFEYLQRARRKSAQTGSGIMGDGSTDRSIVVRCACGTTFTLAQWNALDIVGILDDGVDTLHELRNCPCGSTRARRADSARVIVLLNETAKRLRLALGRLRDIDRVTSGLGKEIVDLDRGGNRRDETERERCVRIVRQTIGTIEPHESVGNPGWLATLADVLEARIKTG